MKVAVVTGAARGIGAATARALAREKIAVALLDQDVMGATQVASEITGNSGAAIVVGCDVSVAESVDAALAVVLKDLGEPSILVNNAGVGGPFHRIDEVEDEEWEQIIGSNLKGVFLLSRRLLPIMKARGYGRIVNIASIQGFMGAARSSTYVASKHGMLGYTRALAAEWGEFGITCNAICPGYVQTAMGTQSPEQLRQVLKRSPVKRVALPEEISSLVVYLQGEQSGYINGSAFVIDGGITAHVDIT